MALGGDFVPKVWSVLLLLVSERSYGSLSPEDLLATASEIVQIDYLFIFVFTMYFNFLWSLM